MSCYNIGDGIICVPKLDFECPKCHAPFNDIDDKYLNRCNKNKSGCARVKCSCGTTFLMTFNYKGDAQTIYK